MIEPNFRPNRRPELIAPIENQDSLGFYSSAFQVLQPRENKSPIGFRLMVPISPKDTIKKLN